MRKGMLSAQTHAAEGFRLGGQHAGQQKEALEQLFIVREVDGQPTGPQGNPLGQVDGRSWIGQDDLDGASGGFSFEFDDPADNSDMAALLVCHGRVGYHRFQPPNQLTLLHSQFAAHPDGPDPVHEVHGLALLQAEEGLDVPAAEKRNGFGGMRLGKNFLKSMNVGRVTGQSRILER